MKGVTKGWPPARRRQQAERIKAHQPWKHSTGPKTEEGRAVSARNALKHGFHGAEITRLRTLLAAQRRYVKRALNHAFMEEKTRINSPE